MSTIKQIFHPYEKWEDYRNGMYNEDKVGRKERVLIAKLILTNPQLLEECMRRVVKEWKYATEHNLTNPSINHQAFLGQCACSIYGKVHEDETREAWNTLSNEERYVANYIADKVYESWKFVQEGRCYTE